MQFKSHTFKKNYEAIQLFAPVITFFSIYIQNQAEAGKKLCVLFGTMCTIFWHFILANA